MPHLVFLWTPENEQHIAGHGISMSEFEDVVMDPIAETVSRSSGLPAVFGWTSTGRFLFCVYRVVNDLQVEPITAYEVDE